MRFFETAALFGVAASAATLTEREAALDKRAFKFAIPASKGTVNYSAPQKISGSFDGGMKTYGRSNGKCNGQSEGGQADTVFLLNDGATLQNAIIGENQAEGVYCLGACTIKNVWWTKVCEDALSLKGNGNVLIQGGGARGASDKVIQHNGIGSVTIDGFSADNFGKLYRSCGNCKGNAGPRKVTLKNIKVNSGKALVGINTNYGDTATFGSGNCATGVKKICTTYTGNSNGKEPKEGADCSPKTLPAC